SDYTQRREMVRALIAAGLPAPLYPSGEILDAFWRAGFFRLRGVLVGTLAYACYGPLLGVRLPAASLRTDDADFAQFWGISENIGESMKPPLEILRGIDPTYREVPDINDPFVTTRYVNATNFKVEFLTPNRGSDEHQGKPARMKALAGSGAQPLRHLDYLIHQPERSAILYSAGVPVIVPRAERYAIHKLIVAVERQDQVKSTKDVTQAGGLIQSLVLRRPLELAEAWTDAWAVGERWREKLTRGRERLTEPQRAQLADVIERAERLRTHSRRDRKR
ncbi:MAG: GSU2403 family nucleotidyltransferase fold protein, partial [Rhodoglobus sp.]|nr:GSU2403 family nucleotidyltransferase fold protein [Rhodoglobus sp.]